MRCNWWEPSPLASISLDQLVAGHTCDPISLADFEAYLQYKEHTLENLQFVIWFQSYRARFFDLAPAVQALSPGPAKFTFNPPDSARLQKRVEESGKMYEALTLQRLQSRTHQLNSPISPISPTSFCSSSTSPMDHIHSMSSPLLKQRPQTFLGSFQPLQREYLDKQPMRKECAAVLQTFIISGAPKELSLSDEMREMVLKDATWNTHPDVFLAVYEQIYDTLSTQSLPRFLALSSTNVNLPKALYWYAFGVAYILFALVIFICTALLGPTSVRKRAWRCFSIPFSSLGSMLLYSGYKGLCTEVWSRGRAQLRPWELQLYGETVDDEENTVTHQLVSGSGLSSSSSSRGNGGLNSSSTTVNVNGSGGGSGKAKAKGKEDEEFGHELATLRNGVDVGVGVEPDTTNTDAPSSLSLSVVTTSSKLTAPPSSSSSPFSSPPSLLETPKNNKHSEDPQKAEKEEVTTTVKPKMFGPERPLLDPRIRRVHALIVRDMALVGVVWTTVWVVLVCCVPARGVRGVE
ncbi:hypothetical protein BXZ70DRAFT_1009622 [Cristinia sonorae]|uniref:RGS domain-containing protein n=1 Tax=Cristinia sonorae TaxID=1940300 RepID=A0A8K0UL49_9AGAR|nr:hypothetical protein BXZ70DRAFT_1009622 [Cristinia sonorae]